MISVSHNSVPDPLVTARTALPNLPPVGLSGLPLGASTLGAATAAHADTSTTYRRAAQDRRG